MLLQISCLLSSKQNIPNHVWCYVACAANIIRDINYFSCRKDLNGTNAKGKEKTLTHVFEEDSLESPYSSLHVSIYESRDIYEINKAFLTGLYMVT